MSEGACELDAVLTMTAGAVKVFDIETGADEGTLLEKENITL
jgi:hypothetical protein